MKNVPPIFKDEELQLLFMTQGYVKVPFLDEEQIAYLNKLFDELHPQLPESGFISGSYSGDWEYKKKASDEITKTFAPSYERYFQNYQPFGGSFLFKVPSDNSDLVLHQDWTVVDEDKYVALNCWVPLCDTDVNNGTLMVLPGAHNGNYKVKRAPTLNFFFTGNEDVIMDKLEPMNAKAGEAVILNESLVHYSPPNKSDKIRKAITAGVKTKGAPMLFYYSDQRDGQDTLDVFEMEEDFLIMFDDFVKDIFQPPVHGKKIGTVDYKLPQPSREELETLINEFLVISGRKPKVEERRGLFIRVKELFGIGA